MKKKCEQCGYATTDEQATFCERCGSPLTEERNTEEDRRLARLKKTSDRKKTLFVLAFVGLLLDFIVGIGWILCLPVCICAAVDCKRLYAERKKCATWHVWAIVVGGVGTLFGLTFFLLML